MHVVGGPPLPQSKYNVADGRHLENRYDVILQAVGGRWSDLGEIRHPDAE